MVRTAVLCALNLLKKYKEIYMKYLRYQPKWYMVSPVRYAKFLSIQYFIDIDIFQNLIIDIDIFQNLL